MKKSDHRTTPSIVDIHAARTDVQAKEIRRLLIQEVAKLDLETFPRRIVHDDGTLRPALIGAWAQDHLIGAALVKPAVDFAYQLLVMQGVDIGTVQAARTIAEHVAIVEGIAVAPNHRREGIGLQIKLFCDIWAADHDAALAISIPTNEAARQLNKKAGHIVLRPTDALAIQALDQQGLPLHDIYADRRKQDFGMSLWAFKPLREHREFTIRIGIHTRRASDDHVIEPKRIDWFTIRDEGYLTATEYIR